MYNLKCLFAIIFTILLSIGNASIGSADELYGAEIDWECVGQDTFEVTLYVYKDCKGSTLSDTSLNYSCQPTNTRQIGYQVNDITPLESGCSQCDSASCGFSYGIERHAITWEVDFSGTSCDDVTFSYKNCCRSSDINTGPKGQGLYVEAWMDLAKAPCNNSPQHEAISSPFFCTDEITHFSHGIYSNDKDSIGNLIDSATFEFTQPLKQTGSPVSWNGNYGYAEPFTWRNKGQVPKSTPIPYGFHTNPATGDFWFTPTNSGEISVVASRFNEYRNNQLVAYTVRDMTYFVLDCPINSSPYLTGINCNNPLYKEVCAGQTLDFCTNDPDTNNLKLDFRRGNLPEGVTWSVDSTQSTAPTGQLHLPDSLEDLSSRPYTFSIEVRDTHHLNGSISKTYRLKIHPLFDVNYNITNKGCGDHLFEVSSPDDTLETIDWNGDGGLNADTSHLTHTYENSGTYPLDLTVHNGNCERAFQDTVIENGYLKVDIGSDTVVCQGADITLGNQAIDNKGPVSYTWHDQVTGQHTRTFKNLQKDTLIKLTVQDDSCTYKDSAFIEVKQNPKVNLGEDFGVCAGDTVALAPTVKSHKDTTVAPPWISLDNANHPLFYEWGLVDSNITLSTGPEFGFTDSGTYVLKAEDSLGCKNRDTITIKGGIDPEISAGDTSICEGASVNLEASGGTSYSWSPQSSLSCTDCRFPVASPDSTTTYKLEEKDVNSCKDSSKIKIVVNPNPEADAGSEKAICSGDSITLNASGGAQYEWTSDQKLSCTNCPDPTVSPDSVATYHVTATSSEGCKDTAQTTVTVYDNPDALISSDNMVCQGDSLRLKASGGTSYSWDPKTNLSCNNCSSPWATPDTSTAFAVTVTDTNGCQDIAQKFVEVLTGPNANAGPGDTICQNSDSAVLNASEGTSHHWQPAKGLSCTNCQSPHAKPDTTTDYTVTITDSAGCQDTSKVRVLVEDCTGIPEIESIKRVRIYPNPNKGRFVLEFNSKKAQSIDIQLYSTSGKLVYSKNLKSHKGDFQKALKFNHLPKGVYNLKLITVEGILTKQVVLH